MFSNGWSRYSRALCLFIYGCTVFGKAPSALGVKSADYSEELFNRSAVTFVALLCVVVSRTTGTPTHTNKTLLTTATKTVQHVIDTLQNKW